MLQNQLQRIDEETVDSTRGFSHLVFLKDNYEIKRFRSPVAENDFLLSDSAIVGRFEGKQADWFLRLLFKNGNLALHEVSNHCDLATVCRILSKYPKKHRRCGKSIGEACLP